MYKYKNPRLSSQQVAKKFGMSSSTLNRIQNLDIKEPTLNQVIKVLKGTGRSDELIDYLNIYFPDIPKVFEERMEGSGDFANANLMRFFESRDTFLIMLLAYSGIGVTEEEVQHYFGIYGVSQLKMLVEEGVLTKKDSRYFGDDHDGFELTFPCLRKVLSSLIETCYRPDKVQEGNNYIVLRTFVANKEKVMPLIGKALIETRKQLNEIISEHEFKGTDHIFIGLVTDQILHD
jgi:transcriptional regulator with XRE-family HTH domain